MSLINIANLTFAYEGSYDNIFENVSIRLDTAWKVGLVGRNGRGKTTLFKLLRGQHPYEGTISAQVDFTCFPYEVEDASRLTLDIAEELIPQMEEWKLFRELGLLRVDAEVLYRPFDTLSSGERTKVLLAALFLRENSFLLIDEPTNHLDGPARDQVASYLNGKQGFILISHDREFLDQCVDHILSINRAGLELTRGSFSEWYERRQALDRAELEQNERLKGSIRRLTEAAQRASDWSDKVEKTKHGGKQKNGLRPDRGHAGHQAAKLMKRSKSLERRRMEAAEQKAGLLQNIETAEPLKLSPLRYHADRLLSLDAVELFYGERQVCGPVSFEIRRGERVCLAGANGCGKSSVLKLILGEAIRCTGGVHIGSQLKISHIPQDSSFLHGSLDDFAAQNRLDESLFKAILRKLNFERVQFEKDLSQLSEGQKKKVLLARSLCEQAHLYVWDEPLNFVDILSRIQIEELLTEFQPALLFVEHDRRFRDKIATKTIWL
ncbi:MAG: ABC-F type ribosomal protection protein [Clostridiales bacterium]|nr:ABC-F type ribosomal protection protein [Clostridiales bacterium]